MNNLKEHIDAEAELTKDEQQILTEMGRVKQGAVTQLCTSIGISRSTYYNLIKDKDSKGYVEPETGTKYLVRKYLREQKTIQDKIHGDR